MNEFLSDHGQRDLLRLVRFERSIGFNLVLAKYAMTSVTPLRTLKMRDGKDGRSQNKPIGSHRCPVFDVGRQFVMKDRWTASYLAVTPS